MNLRRGTCVAVLLIAVLSFNIFAGGAFAKSYGVTEAAKDLGSLSNFSASLQQTGLADALNNNGVLVFGNISFLVFAPNDAAFADLTGIDLSANETALKRVISYHIACGS